jgi:hypothetical protein
MKILHISTVQVLLSAEKCSVGFDSYSTWIPGYHLIQRRAGALTKHYNYFVDAARQPLMTLRGYKIYLKRCGIGNLLCPFYHGLRLNEC